MSKYNRDKKSLNTTLVIYADTESLLEKIHTCDNNPKESVTSKLSKNTECSCYSIFTQCSLNSSKNKSQF